jgi:protocatechuate 3,4-dioxygenase beta subunit
MNEREKDDQETGRILTRREVFSILSGVAGAGILGSVAQGSVNPVPGCVGRPEQTEGPYYLETNLNRSDIRSDPSDGSLAEGVPLLLEFRVSRVSGEGCAPLPRAVVHVWHCDAHGVYSGVRDPSFDTTGKKFLRGYQVTDNAGMARFQTIFPGWYPGRTVHMHFKIRTGTPGRKGSEFTSQLYFDDATTDKIYLQGPYSKRGKRHMRNSDDFLFRSGGKDLILTLAPNSTGYAGAFEIGLT